MVTSCNSSLKYVKNGGKAAVTVKTTDGYNLSSFTFVDSEGTKLKLGTDFKKTDYVQLGEVLDPKNGKAQKYEAISIKFEGINNFVGSEYTILFYLRDAAQVYPKKTKSITSAKFKIHDYVYTGRNIIPSTALIDAKMGKTTLRPDTDFYVKSVDKAFA